MTWVHFGNRIESAPSGADIVPNDDCIIQPTQMETTSSAPAPEEPWSRWMAGSFQSKGPGKEYGPHNIPRPLMEVSLSPVERNRCRCTFKEKEGRWQKATQDQKSESSCLSPHQPLRNWMLWRNVTNPLVSENFYSGWEEGKGKRSSWFHQSIRWHFGKMFPSNSVFVSFRDFWSGYWSLPLF